MVFMKFEATSFRGPDDYLGDDLPPGEPGFGQGRQAAYSGALFAIMRLIRTVKPRRKPCAERALLTLAASMRFLVLMQGQEGLACRSATVGQTALLSV